MLTAHVHTSALRPDRVYSTSVITPYDPRLGPVNVARAITQKFARVAGNLGDARMRPGMLPEEYASIAMKVAHTMRAGYKMPRGIDHKLLAMARMINKGQPFVIRSAGRAALIAQRGPSSWAVIRQEG